MTGRATVSRWVAACEAAWRAPGPEELANLFTDDASYLKSPYEQPMIEGPGEVFTLTSGILAADGPTAVVRAEVCYAGPPRQEYRDLWVIRLTDDGRCRWLEEWPYWPGRPYTAPR